MPTTPLTRKLSVLGSPVKPAPPSGLANSFAQQAFFSSLYISIPLVSSHSCVTLGQQHNLSEPQNFRYLKGKSVDTGTSSMAF